jgi:excisionase family DNA binding protein
MNDDQPVFISIDGAANYLGVPRLWLRNEAKQGRIPFIKAGKVILVHLELVEKQLIEQSKGNQPLTTKESI